MTSTDSGLCWRNAGRSTWSRKAQCPQGMRSSNTSASVAVSMLMAARMPSVPSAPSTVSRVQWLHGMVAQGAGALQTSGLGADHGREDRAFVQEDEALRSNGLKLGVPLLPGLGDRGL